MKKRQPKRGKKISDISDISDKQLESFFATARQEDLRRDEKLLMQISVMGIGDFIWVKLAPARGVFSRAGSWFKGLIPVMPAVRPAVVVLSLLLLLAGVVPAWAMNQAVPGDIFYGAKLKAHELIAAGLDMLPQQAATWEVWAMERRLEELQRAEQRETLRSTPSAEDDLAHRQLTNEAVLSHHQAFVKALSKLEQDNQADEAQVLRNRLVEAVRDFVQTSQSNLFKQQDDLAKTLTVLLGENFANGEENSEDNGKEETTVPEDSTPKFPGNTSSSPSFGNTQSQSAGPADQAQQAVNSAADKTPFEASANGGGLNVEAAGARVDVDLSKLKVEVKLPGLGL